MEEQINRAKDEMSHVTKTGAAGTACSKRAKAA
jgi:hypothetical protein